MSMIAENHVSWQCRLLNLMQRDASIDMIITSLPKKVIGLLI
jgi:hypothetical protein